MKIRCEYCEQFIDDTEETCPHCGAVNPAASRAASGVPRTVEELKAFAERHNLPLAKMRVFLGENYTGPRAYGIYRDEDSGEFVVYKNKSDGSRAVRYRGHDEAYAVGELYQKMKSEVASQKSRLAMSGGTSRGASAFTDEERRRDLERRFGVGQGAGSSTGSQAVGCLSRLLTWLGRIVAGSFGLLVVLVILGGIVTFIVGRQSPGLPAGGYYRYEDTTYYPWHGDWYYWDDTDSDWYETDPPSGFTDHYDDYFVSDSYYDYDGFDDGFESFYNGSVYQNYSDSYDSDYDSDSSWSSSWDDDDWDDDWDDDDWDWDSGDDWDSDWSDWDSDW